MVDVKDYEAYDANDPAASDSEDELKRNEDEDVRYWPISELLQASMGRVRYELESSECHDRHQICPFEFFALAALAERWDICREVERRLIFLGNQIFPNHCYYMVVNNSQVLCTPKILERVLTLYPKLFARDGIEEASIALHYLVRENSKKTKRSHPKYDKDQFEQLVHILLRHGATLQPREYQNTMEMAFMTNNFMAIRIFYTLGYPPPEQDRVPYSMRWCRSEWMKGQHRVQKTSAAVRRELSKHLYRDLVEIVWPYLFVAPKQRPNAAQPGQKFARAWDEAYGAQRAKRQQITTVFPNAKRPRFL